MPDGPRVLILSASVGEGHDLPARVIGEEILEREPGAYTAIEDSLEFAPRWVARAVEDGARRINGTRNSVFEAQYRALSVWPTRRAASWAMEKVALKGIARVTERHRPDVIVSTYPGATEALGRMRRKGLLDVPVASAITDLAALRYWASPGVDLHLIIHSESRQEVEEIAPGSRIEAANGMYLSKFREPRDRAEARHDLGLPAEGPIVLVSGGGWGVGDVLGAVRVAREQSEAVIALCGRNEELRAELQRLHPDLRAEGFTNQVSDFMAAGDVLVHSSAGLTVLEALIRGCAPVSYGWGAGHIAVNNRAYTRFGLARVADDLDALRLAVKDALADPIEPDSSFARLPRAADLVLGLVLSGKGVGHGAGAAEDGGPRPHRE